MGAWDCVRSFLSATIGMATGQNGDLVGEGVVLHVLNVLLFVRTVVFLTYTNISLYCKRRSCVCFVCAALVGVTIKDKLVLLKEKTRGQIAQHSKCYVITFA